MATAESVADLKKVRDLLGFSMRVGVGGASLTLRGHGVLRSAARPTNPLIKSLHTHTHTRARAHAHARAHAQAMHEMDVALAAAEEMAQQGIGGTANAVDPTAAVTAMATTVHDATKLVRQQKKLR